VLLWRKEDYRFLFVEDEMSERKVSPFWRCPSTKLGWWVMGLAIGWVVLNFGITAIMNIRSRMAITTGSPVAMNFGFLMLLVGLAAGITALIAILRKHERSWLVWASLLPGVSTIVLLIGEFTIPH
jgi:hypothetical protein